MGIMKQILSALNYCHQHGIVHRDIKAENVLFNSKNIEAPIKIIDFGISIKFEKDTKIKHKAGTILYIAPEILEGEYDEKCDIWACGVLLYLLISGEPPFFGENKQQITWAIKRARPSFKNEIWSKVTPACSEIVKKMLVRKPEDRPSCAELLKDPWFGGRSKDYIIKSKKYIESLQRFEAQSSLSHAILTFIVTNIAHKEAHEDLLRLFREMDRDNDGKITAQELVECFEEVYPYKSKGDIMKEVKSIIKKIDSNNSGSIDFTEYLVAAMQQQINISKEILESTFLSFDTDGDGQITKQEFMKIMKNVSCSENTWGEFLKECDSDNDGQVNLFPLFRYQNRNFLTSSKSIVNKDSG